MVLCRFAALKSKAMLNYISLSRKVMFLIGQYECHGLKHSQCETTWRSSPEPLELTRRKGSKRLRKLRQSAEHKALTANPEEKVTRFSACVISSHSVSEEGLVYSSSQMHRNGSSGLEHQFNKGLVTQPLYYAHYIYSKNAICLYESNLRSCVKNQRLRK
jgi:hypothetical protein